MREISTAQQNGEMGEADRGGEREGLAMRRYGKQGRLMGRRGPGGGTRHNTGGKGPRKTEEGVQMLRMMRERGKGHRVGWGKSKKKKGQARV